MRQQTHECHVCGKVLSHRCAARLADECPAVLEHYRTDQRHVRYVEWKGAFDQRAKGGHA